MSKGKHLRNRLTSTTTSLPEVLAPTIVLCRLLMVLALLLLLPEILMPMSLLLRMEVLSIIILLAVLIYFCVNLARSKDEKLRELDDKRAHLTKTYERLSTMRAKLDAKACDPPDHLGLAQAAVISEIEELNQRKIRLEASEQLQLKNREARKNRLIEMAASRAQALINLELDERRQLETEIDTQIVKLKDELRRLELGQEQDFATELAKNQIDSVSTFLQGYKILESPIIGISELDKKRFLLLGLVTAFDVDEKSLQGLGLDESKKKTILRWRRFLQEHAEIQKPAILAGELRKKIRKRYEKPRRNIELEIDGLNVRIRRETQEIKLLYEIARTQLGRIEKELAEGTLLIAEQETQFAVQLRDIDFKYKTLVAKLRQIKSQEASAKDKLQIKVDLLDRETQKVKEQLDKMTKPSKLAYFRFIAGLGKSDWLSVFVKEEKTNELAATKRISRGDSMPKNLLLRCGSKRWAGNHKSPWHASRIFRQLRQRLLTASAKQTGGYSMFQSQRERSRTSL